MRKTLIVLAAIAAAGCAKSGTPAADTTAGNPGAMMPAASIADAKAEIWKVRDAWVAAAEKKDAAAVAALYSDDAVVVGTDMPATSGRPAIRAAFAKAFPMTTDLKVNSQMTDVSGDLAYDYGTYSEHVSPPKGKPMDVSGTFLVTLRRQSDGSWKIVRHLTATPPKG